MNVCVTPPALAPALSAKDLHRLTPAEQVVARHILHGFTNKQIAVQLSKAPSTVKAQVSSILHRLGVRTRAELIAAFIDPALTLSGHGRGESGAAAGVDPQEAGGVISAVSVSRMQR
ncbi:MAG: response regulator transcription factor [Opitutaceae bacterium]|nr:response regulator transcription factor [Opitutaceae bacterium]